MKKAQKLRPCDACGNAESERGNQARLWEISCVCGKSHRCCKVCRAKVSIGGEFPNYDIRLKACPIAVRL